MEQLKTSLRRFSINCLNDKRRELVYLIEEVSDRIADLEGYKSLLQDIEETLFQLTNQD